MTTSVPSIHAHRPSSTAMTVFAVVAAIALAVGGAALHRPDDTTPVSSPQAARDSGGFGAVLAIDYAPPIAVTEPTASHDGLGSVLAIDYPAP